MSKEKILKAKLDKITDKVLSYSLQYKYNKSKDKDEKKHSENTISRNKHSDIDIEPD